MPEFVFDEHLHEYRVDGQRWPSVTQLIQDAGLSDYSMVPPALLEKARQWGNAVHKLVELYLFKDLDTSTLDDALFPVLHAFDNWYKKNIAICGNDEYRRIEEPMYHSKLKYAGTPDIVFPNLIIDVKSRPVNMLTDSIQCVAYDELDGGDREHRILVLNQDGTYLYQRVNATKAKRRESWQRFRYLLTLHEMKKEIAKWR